MTRDRVGGLLCPVGKDQGFGLERARSPRLQKVRGSSEGAGPGAEASGTSWSLGRAEVVLEGRPLPPGAEN